MATQKKKGTSWEDVMNIIQERAGRSGQTVTMTFSPQNNNTYLPIGRQPAAPRKNARPQGNSGQQGNAGQPYNVYLPIQAQPANKKKGKPASTNVVTYQERPPVSQIPAGFLAPGQQGPPTRRQAQGGYSFTQAQPALAAAAADKIRNQYAGIQTGSGGAFTTDTNEGLLQLLQAAGITPTPLNQWGQLATRLRR